VRGIFLFSEALFLAALFCFSQVAKSGVKCTLSAAMQLPGKEVLNQRVSKYTLHQFECTPGSSFSIILRLKLRVVTKTVLPIKSYISDIAQAYHLQKGELEFTGVSKTQATCTFISVLIIKWLTHK
jgi:hypothetical protein